MVLRPKQSESGGGIPHKLTTEVWVMRSVWIDVTKCLTQETTSTCAAASERPSPSDCSEGHTRRPVLLSASLNPAFFFGLEIAATSPVGLATWSSINYESSRAGSV
jgi:hypothetical protein